MTRSNRIVVLGLKYIPVLATLLLTVHVGLLLFGIYEPVTVSVAALLFAVLVYFLSIRFNFCRLHRALVVYAMIMTACICLQKYGVFGITLNIFRMAMFIFGIVLIVLMVEKLIAERNAKCK